MLTIFALEILNSGGVSKKNNKSLAINSGSEVINNLKEEQLKREKTEKMEIFFMLLPLIILLSGAIIMYILEKIFLK